ncbi:O-antigen ligase family protein [Flavobacterium rhizosphaerae]|uniref:O-antigen ligase family protein n=1 Tax=Flavobacterium rhizosphaerae TaxID=3163298 RepID=A0ABW8Z0N7_9FLAO
MKISPIKIYAPLFIIVVLLQLYLPSFKINFFIQLATLAFCIFIDYRNIAFTFGFLKYLIPLLLLLFIGFIGMVLHRYYTYNIIKDIVHFIKPITGIALGYIFFKRVNNFRHFLYIIVIAGIISSVIHFYIIAFLLRDISSVDGLRDLTRDNFLDLFALFFLIFTKKFQGQRLFSNPLITYIAMFVLVISNVLYFSRTMIIEAIILLFSIYGFTKITSRNLKFAGLFMISVFALYAFLYSININRGQRGLEGFLYKIKNAPEEIFQTKIDRDNHQELWDHWRGYEMKRGLSLMNDEPQSYIYGTGFGSLVNLKFYAPLTGEPKGIRYISELHNGYIYILYKTGIIGILIYIFMLGRWYLYIHKENTLPNLLVSAIGIIYLISTVTITGIYNTRDIIIFILGGALYYAEKINKNTLIKHPK